MEKYYTQEIKLENLSSFIDKKNDQTVIYCEK